jgi:chromosomal replication initiator protein
MLSLLMNDISLNSNLTASKDANKSDLLEFDRIQNENWAKSKELIFKSLKQVVWKAWIEPLNYERFIDGVLYINAKSTLIANRAETQYYETIFLKANNYFENLKTIKISSVEKDDNIIKNNNKLSSDNKAEPASLTNLSFVDSVSMKLNSSLTFDNFVVGESNRMAYAASKRICDAKSLAYNPLYIHGNVGMGKTHLLNAIAIELRKSSPDLQIALMSAERFMYQFIKAIRLKDTLSFKDQFRSIDILMIDDIQFIGGKGSTQEEFFYTFNDLINLGKQIVITSNKSPFELTDLDDKLKSRLGGGLVIDFTPTDYKLRLDILKKKVGLLNIVVPIEVLDFLATKITNNIRELEGALNRICANYELTGKEINISNSEELLSDILTMNQKKISIDYIKEKVCSYFNLNLSHMTSSRRSINIARPRQIAMYLCKLLTTFSYPEIGKNFGGKDHTTVMHAVKKIEALLIVDQNLKKQIFDIKKSINLA